MVLVSILVTIIVILFLVNKKVNLGLTLLISSLVLLVLNGINPLNILGIIQSTATSQVTIDLLLAVTFITILSKFMSDYHILDRMIDSLEGVLRSVKATILLTPPLMGLLLVSGGALLSAPVIENLGDRLGFSKKKSAAVNMIFRHGLYFVYPLSTTIILTATLSGYSVNQFISYMWPTALALYFFGYLTFLKGVKDVKPPKTSISQYLKNLLLFVFYSSPLSVSIFLTVALGVKLYMAMIAGIIICLLIHNIEVLKGRERSRTSFLKLTIGGINYQMLFTLFGMFLFKNAVNSLDGVELALAQVINSGIPIEVILISFTMILSLATGSIQPSVALLIPIVIPMAASTHELILYSTLIYVSGFVGYFVSPLHMCQVVTVQYFKIETKDIYYYYKYIIAPMYIVSLVVYFIQKML